MAKKNLLIIMVFSVPCVVMWLWAVIY